MAVRCPAPRSISRRQAARVAPPCCSRPTATSVVQVALALDRAYVCGRARELCIPEPRASARRVDRISGRLIVPRARGPWRAPETFPWRVVGGALLCPHQQPTKEGQMRDSMVRSACAPSMRRSVRSDDGPGSGCPASGSGPVRPSATRRAEPAASCSRRTTTSRTRAATSSTAPSCGRHGRSASSRPRIRGKRTGRIGRGKPRTATPPVARSGADSAGPCGGPARRRA